MRTSILIRALVILTLTVVFSSSNAPTLQAAPGSDIWTHYYDCDLSYLGEKFRGCDSTGYNMGQLSGTYKEIESCSCNGTSCTSTWYQWNGTSWVHIAGEPSPSC
jgi:hypothetical protein